MKGYELVLFDSLSVNETMSKVQDFLGIGFSGQTMVTWGPRENISAIDCSRMCSVISAY